MTDLVQVILGGLGGLLCILIGIGIGWDLAKKEYYKPLPNPEFTVPAAIEEPARFRQRTKESDPNRHAKVVTARVRAFRTRTPGPRR
jgi:hypothetical protein